MAITTSGTTVLRSSRRRRSLAFVAFIGLLAGCGPGVGSATSPAASPSPGTATFAPLETEPPVSTSPIASVGAGRIVFTEYEGSGATFKVITLNPDGTDRRVVF